MKTDNKQMLLLFVIAIFLCGTVVGCGKRRPSDFPAVYPCKITVTDAGKPIKDARVVLTPLNGYGNLIVTGTTDSSGTAPIVTAMHTYFEYGVPEGEYEVEISKTPVIEFPVSQEEYAALSESEQRKVGKQIEALYLTTPSEVPRCLSATHKQKLTVVAKKGGRLDVDVSKFKDIPWVPEEDSSE